MEFRRFYFLFVLLVLGLAISSDAAENSSNAAQGPTLVATLKGHPVFGVLPDGRLAAFSLTTLGKNQVVEMQVSTDNSRTWTNPAIVLSLSTDTGRWGGPEILVDREGEIHLIFLNDANTGIYKGGEASGRPNLTKKRLDIWHAKSTAGRTKWLSPKKIWEGYTGSLNSIIQTKKGRIVLPFSYKSDRTWRNRGEGPETFTYMGDYDSTALYSDDGGKTWTLSPDKLKVVTPDIRGAYGAVEPVVLELKDGRVWMLIRSQMGRFYESFSDDGARWSKPAPTSIVSSDSPAGLVRLKDGRILLLWNQCLRYPYAYGGRQVLHGAISEDEGDTWRGIREVMRDPQRDLPPPPGGDFGTAYPFPRLLKDGNVLFTSGQGGGRRATYVLDPEWLTQPAQQTDFSDGLDDWSTYGVKGVELKDASQQPKAKVLRIAKLDSNWEAGAVWNFPAGRSGRLDIVFGVEPGFHSLNLGLTDHYSTPFDEEDRFYNLFNLPIGPNNLINSAKLQVGRRYRLTMKWNTNNRACELLLDGKNIGSLSQTRVTPTGINYLRLRSTSSQPDAGGLLLYEVSANLLSD
ncbi:MAG TPA: sialidase family protein [Terriglobales bacterium]|nr:sialidase family protein [Terriglobales bacterium]